MKKSKLFFNPIIIQVSIILFQFFLFVLSRLGIYKSYTLKNIGFNLFSYFHLLSFYIFLFSCMLIFSLMSFFKKSFYFKYKIHNRTFITFISILFLVAFYASLIYKIGIVNIIELRLQNIIYFGRRFQLVENYNVNSYTTIFWILSVVGSEIIIIYDYKSSFKWIYLSIGIIGSGLFALFLNARVFLIYHCLMIIVVSLFKTKQFFKNKYFIIVVLFIILVLLFLIYSAGNRDYDSFGYFFTESQFSWGLHTIFEYFLSSFNYSLKIAETPFYFGVGNFSMSGTTLLNIRLLFRYRTTDSGGVVAYNNLGFFGHINSAVGLFYPFFIIIFSLIITLSWNSILKLRVFGLMTYPIVMIYLLESYRFCFFFLELGITLFVLTSLISLFLPETLEFK
ncbi:MAG: hypothetical protein RBR15_09165 [Sphaerochaeta sp.]|nr:hypothetical protein [Sphaerochaeta sp.]